MDDELDRRDQTRNPSSNSSCEDEHCGGTMEIDDEVDAASRSSDSSVISRCNSMSGGGEAEGPLYIAVGREYKESKATIIWALRKKRRYKKIVLVHVHCPAMRVQMSDAWLQVSDLSTEQVEAFRLKEVEKMNRTMDDYLYICEVAKVQTEKVVLEMDDVAKGLIQAINRLGITKLVMGAAADKYYSKKMRVPVSKKARTVLNEAPPSCDIWFICKGTLVCTRAEATSEWSIVSQSLMSSGQPSRPELVISKTMPRTNMFTQGLCDDNPLREDASLPLPNGGTDQMSRRGDALFPGEEDEWIGSKYGSVQKGEFRNYNSSKPVLSQLAKQSEESIRPSSTNNQVEDLEIYDDWNVYLQEVMTEAAKLVNGAYIESRMRHKAEQEALEANNRIKVLEMDHSKETKSKIEVLEKLLKKVQGELTEACEQNAQLQAKITESDNQVKKLEEKLSVAEKLLDMRDESMGRDRVVKQGKEMQKSDASIDGDTNQFASIFEVSSLELKQATCNFERSLKIGEGASGCVYKGFLHRTYIAVKVLHPQSACGQADFQNEVEILCKLRHPNLASLIGACPEERTLVYEFIPNGCLEDHLAHKFKSSPLSWGARIEITAGICSALIFLHSSKPQPIIHGDLRPANIMLDANFASKVMDFGLVRLLDHSNSTIYNWNDPKGAFAYMDPEFFSTGELTTRSDVYSFGIVILRLLTGRPPLGIVKEVQEALDGGRLKTVLDPTAGDWPFLPAQQMALLGLKCSEMKRKSRPDLAKDVLKILESFKVMSLS